MEFTKDSGAKIVIHHFENIEDEKNILCICKYFILTDLTYHNLTRYLGCFQLFIPLKNAAVSILVYVCVILYVWYNFMCRTPASGNAGERKHLFQF